MMDLLKDPFLLLMAFFLAVFIFLVIGGVITELSNKFLMTNDRVAGRLNKKLVKLADRCQGEVICLEVIHVAGSERDNSVPIFLMLGGKFLTPATRKIGDEHISFVEVRDYPQPFSIKNLDALGQLIALLTNKEVKLDYYKNLDKY